MAKKVKKGAPGWMATFADMSTLLLTFFIILLSMANMDVQKFKDLLGSVREAFGVQFVQPGEYQAVVVEEPKPVGEPGEGEYAPREDDTGVEEDLLAEIEAERLKEEEKRQIEEAAQDIRDAIDKTRVGDNTEVIAGENGIRIRVKGALLFEAGEAQLRPQARPFLDNLVVVLEKFDYNLLVEGHTDSTPIKTAMFPSNWELSGYRAASVLRYLITWGIDPHRLTSMGMADTYPIADNSTPEGRATNRRVEFVLTKKNFRTEIN